MDLALLGSLNIDCVYSNQGGVLLCWVLFTVLTLCLASGDITTIGSYSASMWYKLAKNVQLTFLFQGYISNSLGSCMQPPGLNRALNCLSTFVDHPLVIAAQIQVRLRSPAQRPMSASNIVVTGSWSRDNGEAKNRLGVF